MGFACSHCLNTIPAIEATRLENIVCQISGFQVNTSNNYVATSVLAVSKSIRCLGNLLHVHSDVTSKQALRHYL